MSASTRQPLPVVICWHMHQPEYRDPLDGSWMAPWTYLHAIKDYVDMAAHLEAAPEGIQVVVNFPPLLLEQIQDYAARIRRFLETQTPIGDPLLDALAAESLPRARGERKALLRRCLQAHPQHMVEPFPAFQHLAGMARHAQETDISADYLSDRHLKDILVWYHLAWLGETVRRGNDWVQRLMAREYGYTREDRRELLVLIGELLEGLIGRYRRLAAQGTVELSTSPYSHPMLPLLLDLGTARQARPDIPLPEALEYPGGEERVRWQLRHGREVFRRFFGFLPAGCWPSEGGLCERSIELIGEAGFEWTASGEGVLRNSLENEDPGSDERHRPWRLRGKGPLCFFRDEGLSDGIGFNYQQWHADDAVEDFITHLRNIAGAPHVRPGRLVAVILDGENPWEHYPANGFNFLEALYRRLAEVPEIRVTGFSDCGRTVRSHCARLEQLVSGSWVYGTLDTWIGHEDKNRAWDLLCAAKSDVDSVLATLEDDRRRRRIEQQLAICEGSDWFWWFGDYNPAEAVAEFDRLYRRQLQSLYEMLEIRPPEALFLELSRGSGEPEMGGTMRRGHE